MLTRAHSSSSLHESMSNDFFTSSTMSCKLIKPILSSFVRKAQGSSFTLPRQICFIALSDLFIQSQPQNNLLLSRESRLRLPSCENLIKKNEQKNFLDKANFVLFGGGAQKMSVEVAVNLKALISKKMGNPRPLFLRFISHSTNTGIS